MTPEGLVLEKCKKLLAQMELQEKIIYWERMTVGTSMNVRGFYQKTGRSGSPDIWAFAKSNGICWVLFFEVKRPEGGKQSDLQKQFESRFMGLTNVIYAIITDAVQIRQIVHDIISTDKDFYKKLDELPLNVG